MANDRRSLLAVMQAINPIYVFGVGLLFIALAWSLSLNGLD